MTEMNTLHFSIIVIFLIGLISIHSVNGVLADNTFIGSYVVKDDLALINNQTYYISKPYNSYDSNQTIIFHNVVFAMPTAFASPPDPSGMVFSLVKFPDGSTEKLGVGVPTASTLTTLSIHANPQAAFTRFMNNTFVFLVSQDLGLSSPLKQFKSGIAANDVKCEQGLQLVIKAEDNSPACVKDTSIGRLVRQGWWAWNDKVGDTVVNTSDKRNFDNKSCGIPQTMSSIIGTNGFVRDNLPHNGITYSGVNLTGSQDSGIQFAIMPNSVAQITFTYDFNPYPGTICKVTSKDIIANAIPAKPDVSISDLLRSPDILEVDKTRIRTDVPPLGDSGDVQVKLVNVEDLNDHVVKVTYQIISKPTSQIGKSYFLGFWWHSAVGVTVGNDLYNGTAFSGPRFG